LFSEREKTLATKKEAARVKKESTLKDREKKLATWEQAKLTPKEFVKQEYDVEINVRSPPFLPVIYFALGSRGNSGQNYRRKRCFSQSQEVDCTGMEQTN
jgi:hypothetical protein